MPIKAYIYRIIKLIEGLKVWHEIMQDDGNDAVMRLYRI